MRLHSCQQNLQMQLEHYRPDGLSSSHLFYHLWLKLLLLRQSRHSEPEQPGKNKTLWCEYAIYLVGSSVWTLILRWWQFWKLGTVESWSLAGRSGSLGEVFSLMLLPIQSLHPDPARSKQTMQIHATRDHTSSASILSYLGGPSTLTLPGTMLSQPPSFPTTMDYLPWLRRQNNPLLPLVSAVRHFIIVRKKSNS